MWGDKIADMIKSNEGCKQAIYRDTRGILTGGIGHAFTEGSHLPWPAIERLFWFDMRNAYDGYERFCKRTGTELEGARKAVIIDMIYQMGFAGVMKFEKMIRALKIERYGMAAVQILDSLYAKQTPERATRNSRMMGSGKWTK